MPLAEFLRMAREKLQSDQKKPCSPDISSRDENELAELVWENGQIVMQGQSSRNTKSPVLHGLPSNATPRSGKFGGVETLSDDISPGGFDLSQDDEIVPWLNCPIDNAVPNYCSELLPAISGVTANVTSNQNSTLTASKRSSFDQSSRNLHSSGNVSKVPSSKNRLLSLWPPQEGKIMDLDARNENSAQCREIVNDSASLKIDRQNLGTRSNTSNFLDFARFSTPASLVKANHPTSGGIPAPTSLSLQRMEVKEKDAIFGGCDPVKPRPRDRFNTTKNGIESHVPSAECALVSSRQQAAKVPKESFAERTQNLFRQNSVKSDNASKVVPDGEGTQEPVVASSSVGSGNSADIYSCEQTHNSKRKFLDIEESECHSDDVETESAGVRKTTRGTGSKRSRAAEVHNLSERRRRDRINEKMHALQELIPNCNKVDKASMLDEAIEYLKTLQLQVQIMSMRTGLCMPQMMFPTGFQHMHPAQMPHFPPMGVGMGMVDINRVSSSFPILPVPPVQGVHFPSPMSAPVNFQGSRYPNLPVYGHPTQGFPITPLVHLTGRPPVTSAIGLTASRVESPSELPNPIQTLNFENLATNRNSQLMHNAETRGSINQMQAKNDVKDQSAAVQDNKHAKDVWCPAALTSTKATGVGKENGCD